MSIKFNGNNSPNSPIPSNSMKNAPELGSEKAYLQDFSGEMSKLLERFHSDMHKTMQAKRKKLEQFTQETNKRQSVQRRKLIDHFQSTFSAMIQQGESELEKIKDLMKKMQAEEKMQKLLVQQQKHQQQVRIAHSQRLKNFSEEFCKGMNELEESHVEIYSAVHNDLREEMALLQKKNLMETQQQEMMKVRKQLKQFFG